MSLEEELFKEQINTTIAEREYWKQKKLAAERESSYWFFKADHEKHK